MKKIALAIIVIISSSCNHPKKPDDGVPYNPTDLVKTVRVQVTLPAKDNIHPLVAASGKETGWLCEFYLKKIRFLYNNYRDSVITGADFTWDLENGTLLNPAIIGGENDKFNIRITENNCVSNVDDSVKVREIIIRNNGKMYTGCAILTQYGIPDSTAKIPLPPL